MPERRATGRKRRSIGFPMLTLLLLTLLLAALVWALLEFVPSVRSSL